jgi:hypothetical protein
VARTGQQTVSEERFSFTDIDTASSFTSSNFNHFCNKNKGFPQKIRGALAAGVDSAVCQ